MSTPEFMDWVCLVTPEELEARRALQAVQNQGAGFERGPLHAPLWRQVKLTASSTHIAIELGNVDEAAANARRYATGCATRLVKLNWVDLTDFEGLARIFAHEQVCVLHKVSAMVEGARAALHPTPMALAA